MEQYSNNPSNTGQSSPTLSTHQLALYTDARERQLTFHLLPCELLSVLWIYAMQEINIFVRVEL